MRKQTLGVCAPYTWDEPTQMACSVADLAKRLGMRVSWLSLKEPDDKVHFHWDYQVRSATNTDFNKWARSCSYIVWFDSHRNYLKRARELDPRRKQHHTLVVLWHRMENSEVADLRDYDAVVCPAAATYDMFRLSKDRINLRMSSWDSSLRHIRRTAGPVEAGQMRLIVTMDGKTAKEESMAFVSLLPMLLDGYRDLKLTIVCNRNWPKASTNALNVVLKANKDRIDVLHRPGLTERQQAYLKHDAMLALHQYANAGCDALEGLACGLPVVAPDSAPFREFIQNDYNGVLIKCETSRASRGATVPVLTPLNIWAAVHRLLHQGHLFQLQARSWTNLEQRSRAYDQTWQQLWDC